MPKRSQDKLVESQPRQDGSAILKSSAPNKKGRLLKLPTSVEDASEPQTSNKICSNEHHIGPVLLPHSLFETTHGRVTLHCFQCRVLQRLSEQLHGGDSVGNETESDFRDDLLIKVAHKFACISAPTMKNHPELETMRKNLINIIKTFSGSQAPSEQPSAGNLAHVKDTTAITDDHEAARPEGRCYLSPLSRFRKGLMSPPALEDQPAGPGQDVAARNQATSLSEKADGAATIPNVQDASHAAMDHETTQTCALDDVNASKPHLQRARPETVNSKPQVDMGVGIVTREKEAGVATQCAASQQPAVHDAEKCSSEDDTIDDILKSRIKTAFQDDKLALAGKKREYADGADAARAICDLAQAVDRATARTEANTTAFLEDIGLHYRVPWLREMREMIEEHSAHLERIAGARASNTIR